MPDDVALNKLAIIERCLRRVAEEYQGQPARLENFTVQDSIVLNVQRACEAAIDMAMHVVAKRRLGVPQDARSAFELLAV
ncbi:MAG: HepT-like ribonuclease domain-containing protein, partial [Planctomycetota bacterium]